ncbi:hypothetical protein CCAX7_46210 [Capsulimonas corticalis]|uniref:Uncharacterized protein n=1 Tax=Capsulimonas corticalis TaxID=2219043 RepID=A0A402D518_9BACT|nr:hypothetical protein [Capsulimonas corticalis]BDI32570.1 hypothetical protein CCAX7_46210 [Capsulimonas corticalis]
MTFSQALPSFAELTADLPPAPKPSSDAFIAARRDWLRHIEQECARLTQEYEAGNIFVKFNFGQIYAAADVELAQKYNIDYVGLCLILNEKYERSPFGDEKVAQRKKWFDRHYITETRFKYELGALLRTISAIK